jgi:hypothetical protein
VTGLRRQSLVTQFAGFGHKRLLLAGQRFRHKKSTGYHPRQAFSIDIRRQSERQAQAHISSNLIDF